MRKSNTLIGILLAATLALSGCGGAGSTANESENTGTEETSNYPTQPITLVCGYAAGGSSDLLCRILADSMTKEIGQPVTVVNTTGGGGFVAWTDFVNSTDADGYTFALINTPNLIMGKYDEANPRAFDETAMDLLANHVTDYNVIACRKDEARFNDLESFVKYASENDVVFGTSSVGIMSDDDTIAQTLNRELGTMMLPVVTTGAKDNETYLLNGSADVLVGNVSDVLTGVMNGDFEVFCVFAPERVELIPDVPTCEELGFGAIYGHSSRGYAFPQGVDPEIRQVFTDALQKCIESEECIEALKSLGAETNFVPDSEYGTFLDDVRQNAKDIYGVE